MQHKHADTSAPVLPVIAERWSPRAFESGHELDDAVLASALEAARWAPSAGNSQPAHFVVAKRGSETFNVILEHLAPSNAHWARHASALIANVATVQNAAGQANPWALYDLGQAVAYFSLQAHALGLHVHQMGGFDREGMHAALNLSPAQVVETCMAVGLKGDPHTVDLPEHQLTQELGDRTRRDLTQIARIYSPATPVVSEIPAVHTSTPAA